jgi:F0F1-type ATP synthase membrane subunit a
MLLLGMASLSQSITGFMWGINFPIIAPLIVYTQSLLVAVIQAMVFPLLVAIFIRIALTETA